MKSITTDVVNIYSGTSNYGTNDEAWNYGWVLMWSYPLISLHEGHT